MAQAESKLQNNRSLTEQDDPTTKVDRKEERRKKAAGGKGGGGTQVLGAALLGKCSLSIQESWGYIQMNLLLVLLLIKRYNLYKVLACSTTFFQMSLFCATFFQLHTLCLLLVKVLFILENVAYLLKNHTNLFKLALYR